MADKTSILRAREDRIERTRASRAYQTVWCKPQECQGEAAMITTEGDASSPWRSTKLTSFVNFLFMARSLPRSVTALDDIDAVIGNVFRSIALARTR